MYRYVTDEAHARFVEVLPVAGATILEVGAGLGQITTVIARKASVVCALEVVAGQAEFVAERARQCGQSNVAVACGGDDCWLPYRTGLFDVAVLNLVLEWCGMRDPGDAQTSQVRLLAEVKRVLRPGGMLYLCTKNRFGLHYLLGIPDEHVQGIRFGSAMPRWLSRAVLSLRRRGRPAGLLHSYRGIRRMLHAAGYSELRSYWAVPEMRFPRQLIATGAETIAAARASGLVEGDSRRVRTVMPLVPGALVKYVTPGLVFTAWA
jgi:SAM-dependent methyltransferase